MISAKPSDMHKRLSAIKPILDILAGTKKKSDYKEMYLTHKT